MRHLAACSRKPASLLRDNPPTRLEVFPYMKFGRLNP